MSCGGIVAVMVGAVALLIAFASIAFAPILAVPAIVFGIAAFLVWRGKQRADTGRSSPYEAGRRRVPRTEEAAGDPVRDSGTADVPRV